MFKKLDYKDKMLYFLGFLFLSAKITLLIFNPDFFGIITVLDIIVNIGIIFSLKGNCNDVVENFVEALAPVMFIEFVLFLISLLIASIFAKDKSAIPSISLDFFATFSSSAFIAIIIAIVGTFIQCVAEGINDSKEQKREEKDSSIVEEKVALIIGPLRKSKLLRKRLKWDLDDIVSTFEGEDKRIVQETATLIRDMIESCIFPLDTKELVKSLGVNERFYSRFDSAFDAKGLPPSYVKDPVTFHNLVDYGKNYLQILDNIENKSEGVNTEFLEKLYKETSNIFEKMTEVEEKEKIEKLELIIKEATIELKDYSVSEVI